MVAPVTVIIPTYNRCGMLVEAIDSVLTQTLRPSQVIVVDDGSEDGTGAVVRRYGDAVEYCWKDNGGKSSALNLGLSRARGDYIWIFDDDDIAVPDGLERLYRALDAAPDCALAHGLYDNFHETDGRYVYTTPDLTARFPDPILVQVLERVHIFQGATLVRRASIEAVGPFDETMIRSQDYEMLVRLLLRYRSLKVDGVIFHQRQHAAARGTRAVRVPMSQLSRRSLTYDWKILRRTYEAADLSQYLGKLPGEPLIESERSLALVRRFSVMAHKGLWSLALQDLRALSLVSSDDATTILTPDDRAMLRRVFDDTAHNGALFPESSREVPLIRPHLQRLPGRLGREIHAALLISLLWRLRPAYAIRHRMATLRACRMLIRLSAVGPLLEVFQTALKSPPRSASL